MDLIHDTKTTCLFCGKLLHGRQDKKFCHPGCKNQFNNRNQRQERTAINEIDLILKHNRRILKKALGEEATRKISRTELLQKGLRFEFFTHHYTNYKNDDYCFCYDFGYLILDNDRCLVVRSRGAL